MPPVAQRAHRLSGGGCGCRADRGQKSADYGKLRLLTLPKDGHRARARPGAGELRRRHHGLAAVQPAATGPVHGPQRKPAHPARRWRSALRAAGLRPSRRAARATRCCRRCWSAFGDQIAFEDTLDESLDVLFGGDSGAAAGDQGSRDDSDRRPAPTSRAPERPPTGVPTTGDPEKDAQLKQLASQAQQQLKDKDAALRAATSLPTAWPTPRWPRPSRR